MSDDFPPETSRYPSHISGEYHYAHEDLLQKNRTEQQLMFPPTHTHIYIHLHIFVPTTMQSGEYDHAHTYMCFHQQLAHHDIMRMVQGHHPQILNMFGGIQSAELDRLAVLNRISNFHGGFHSHGGYPNSWMFIREETIKMDDLGGFHQWGL